MFYPTPDALALVLVKHLHVSCCTSRHVTRRRVRLNYLIYPSVARPSFSSLPPSSLCFPYTCYQRPNLQTYTMQPSKKHIDKADVESLPLVSSSPPDKKSGGNSDDAEPHAEPHAEHTQGQSGLPDADKQGHQQAPPWIPGDDLSLLRTIRTAPGHNDRQDCFFALCNVKTKDYTRLL